MCMSTVPTGFPTALALPAMPPAVQLGMEMRRRNLTPPPAIAALTDEMERRGLLGNTPGLDVMHEPEFTLDTEQMNQRAGQRFQQIKADYVAPTADQRQQYIDDRLGEWLAGQEANYKRSARFISEWEQQDRHTQMTAEPYLTPQQRDRFMRSLLPMVDQVRDQFGQQFDAENSPTARFIREREDTGHWLIDQYRQAHPQATEQQALAYMHRELARQGYQPAMAGQFGPVIDKKRLEEELERIAIADQPLVDAAPTVLQPAVAGAAGVVKSFKSSLGTFVGTLGAGGISEFLERTTGDDWGFRDQQQAIEHYWTTMAEQSYLLGSSQQAGTMGTVNRFVDLMGNVTGDLAQTIVASSVGAGAAKWAGLSQRVGRLVSQLTGMGFMGVKEGGGAYRHIYAQLTDQGFGHDEANRRALYAAMGVGTVNALLEKVPIEVFAFAKPSQFNRFRAALRGMVVEGSTEATQEMVNILAEFESGAARGPIVNWDNARRIAKAALAGGIVGGGVAAVIEGRGPAIDFEGDPEAQIMELIDRLEQAGEIKAEATEGRESQPDRDGSATSTTPPESEIKTEGETDNVSRETSGGETVKTSRRDPKIIATARQMGSWYAKTFPDDTMGAAAIEAMVGQAGERMRLADVPLAAVSQGANAVETETDQTKIDEIGALSAQEVADMPPAIFFTDATGGALQIADGFHRLLGLQQNPNATTIKAYVPESVAQAIQSGQMGVEAATEAETAVRPDEPQRGAEARPDDEQAAGRSGPGTDAPDALRAEGQQVSAALGVEYNGPQLDDDGTLLFQTYTDPQTGSTFAVAPGEDPQSKLDELRAKFEGAEAQRRQQEETPPEGEQAAEFDRDLEQAAERIHDAAQPYLEWLRDDDAAGQGFDEAEAYERPIQRELQRLADKYGWNLTREIGSMGSNYFEFDLESSEGEILDSFQVRVSNHRQRYGGPVHSFEPSDSIESTYNGLVQIEQELVQRKRASIDDLNESARRPEPESTKEAPPTPLNGEQATPSGTNENTAQGVQGQQGSRTERAEEAFEREYDLARTDPLIGIPNRRAADEQMSDLFARSDQEGFDVAVGGIDLVLFKQVNDVLGHDAGDRALQAAAEAMAGVLRTEDAPENIPSERADDAQPRPSDVFGVFARLGGDEFEFALANVTPQQAEMVAARMQDAYVEAMAREGIELPGGLRTLMAFGFDIRKPSDPRNIDELRKVADQDLETRKEELKRAEGLPMTRGEAEAIIQQSQEQQDGGIDRTLQRDPSRQDEAEAPPETEAVPETERPTEPDAEEGQTTEPAREEVELEEVDTGIEGARVWFEGDVPELKRREIISKMKPEARRPRKKTKSKGPAKPTTPKRSKSHGVLAKVIASLGKRTIDQREHTAYEIDQDGKRVLVTDGVQAMVVTERGDEQFYPIVFKDVRPLADRGKDRARDLRAGVKAMTGTAGKGEPTATVDLESIISVARRAQVMRDDSIAGAIVVVNTDGTVGLAIGHPAFGTAEVNVQDGYRELPVGIDPARLLRVLEAMYAGGMDTVAFYAGHVEAATGAKTPPYLFTAESAERQMAAIVMPVQFEGQAATVEQVRQRGEQPTEEQVEDEGGEVAGSPLGSPMADPGDINFDPASGQTNPDDQAQPPKKQVDGGDKVPDNAADDYTADLLSLDPAAGAFRRTRADRPKKVSQGVAQARARRDGKESLEADNIYRIVSDLARRFGLGAPGVGRARSLKKWAAGFYRPASESMRLRRGSYVSTFLHELGHHLHKVMFPRSKPGAKPGDLGRNDFPKAWRDELHKLGKQLYGNQKPAAGYTAEGWAEVVRFLVTNPAHLKKQAPLVYQQLVRTLTTNHPEVWDALLEARVRLLNAVNIASVDPVDQYIDHDGSRRNFNLTNVLDWLITRATNRFKRLETMKKDLGIEAVAAHRDPHRAALRANGYISGDVKRMMNGGMFDPRDPARKKIGPSLIEILEPVQSNLREWQNYMVARRTLEKRDQGYDVLPQDPRMPDQTSSPKLRDYIARAEEAHPEFKGVAEQFQAFNQWLVQDYAVAYGLVSPEAAQLIVDKNLEYITFRHKKTEDALARKSGLRAPSSGFTGQSSGIKRFREGLGEQLFPPLESFVVSMQGIVSRARLNEVAQQVTDVYEQGVGGAGRWMDKIDRPMESMVVKAEALSTEFAKQLGIGVDKSGNLILPDYLKGLEPAQVDALLDSLIGLEGATFWKPGNAVDRDAKQVTVLRRGKPVFYEIKDAMLFDLLEGVGNPTTANLLIKILSWPRRIIRGGATQYNPSFFIPNFTRDLFQALTMSEADLRDLPAQARTRLRAMKQAFVGGDIHDLFVVSGADMSGIFGEYYNPLTKKLNFDRMFEKPRVLGLVKGDNAMAMVRDMVKLGAIDRLNSSFELANRLGEFAVVYEQARAKGKGEAEAIAIAGQAAADITLDYQRGGTWSKQINEVVPFFNAAMLGAAKLGRFIRKNPAKAMGRIFTFSIVPSFISMLLNFDNEDYWAKPLGQRDRYWYFPLGENDDGRMSYLKLPKPYGIGAFSIFVERSFARMFGIDPQTGERGDAGAYDGAAVAMLNEFRPTINFAGVQPLLEVMAGDQGYSFYRESHIVSAADKDLPFGEQGASRSSDLARVLGGWMDKSPAKIDYLIQGWFGGLGRDVVQVGVDPLIRLVDDEAKTGEPLEFSDWLIVRRFVAGHTRSRHEAISRFYDTHERLKRINRGLASREEDQQRYDAYQQRYAAQLDLWDTYNQAHGRMGSLFGEIRSLYRNRDQYDADKLDRDVTALYEEIIDIARETHQEALNAQENKP